LAGRAALGDFDDDFRANAPTLAYSPIAASDPVCGEVFAHGAVSQRETQGGKFIDAFRGDQQYGAIGAAVKFRVRVPVAFDPGKREGATRDGILWHSPLRDADLKNGTSHLEK